MTDDYFTSARTILILHDLENRAPPDFDLLAKVFGLYAEARLAARIGRAEELVDVAQAEDISLRRRARG